MEKFLTGDQTAIRKVLNIIAEEFSDLDQQALIGEMEKINEQVPALESQKKLALEDKSPQKPLE
jgi:hypothetical protein